MMAMRYAEIYHQFALMSCKVVEDILREAKQTWGENETILDVGCGTGDVTVNVIRKLAPSSSTITGGDISEEMIKYCKEHHSNTNITFIMMDIVDRNLWLSWHKEQFNKIVSFFTIYRVEDDRTAYENVYNLLKPEGEIVIANMLEHTVAKINPYLAKLPKYSEYAEEISKMKMLKCLHGKVDNTLDLIKKIGFNILYHNLRILKINASIQEATDMYVYCTYLPSILPPNLLIEAVEDTKQILMENDILEEEGKVYIQILELRCKK